MKTYSVHLMRETRVSYVKCKHCEWTYDYCTAVAAVDGWASQYEKHWTHQIVRHWTNTHNQPTKMAEELFDWHERVEQR